MLKINNLKVKVDNKIILDNFNMEIETGKVYALMGKNGAGKSTISKIIMRDKKYNIVRGSITYGDIDLLKLNTTDVARLGFFMISQNPIEIAGVSNAEVLRASLTDLGRPVKNILKFNQELVELCNKLNIPKEFIHRDINFNMSGGEKKKNELLHLLVIKPKFIILDEIDSGLDVDSLKLVAGIIKEYYEEYKPTILIITHQENLLKILKPDIVNILENGVITLSGDYALAENIFKNGFQGAHIITGSDKSE